MKKKVIFSLSLACFFGIMWLSSTLQTTNVKPIISEELLIPPKESNPIEYIDEVSPETTNVDNGTKESDFSAVKACSFNFIETDVFTFGDAFQYYRQCLGSDSSFQWKGSTYTTILSEEIIIQVVDSMQVKKESEKNSQVSEIH